MGWARLLIFALETIVLGTRRTLMKKFALGLSLVAISLVSVGCEPAADKPADKPATEATAPADAPAATPAAPADAPAAPADAAAAPAAPPADAAAPADAPK